MFNNLLEFWKGKDFLTGVYEDFGVMLDDAQSMFDDIRSALIEGKPIENVQEKIYNKDKEINAKEKHIRKRIIEHLALQPSVDVSTSLLLMSVVKDAERLGDYNKNLYEISSLLKKPIDEKTYRELFDNVEDAIDQLFMQTKKAFLESNKELAENSWTKKKNITSTCDSIIEKLAASKLSVNEAVCFTLMARYFKRLAAHLTNIATSAIVPLTDLDYYEEKMD